MTCVRRHLVSIADLDAAEIVRILDHGDRYMALADEPIKKLTSLRGRTHARARLTDGEVHVGDVVRPCSPSSPPVLSLKR